MKNFTLPEVLTDFQWEKVKKYALKKMATQFQTWKKKVWTTTSLLIRRLQNSVEHW